MAELSYPEHKHPHGINKPENPQRIWVCDECDCIFTDNEIRIDLESEQWGHKCKTSRKSDCRCESHLESYLPDP